MASVTTLAQKLAYILSKPVEQREPLKRAYAVAAIHYVTSHSTPHDAQDVFHLMTALNLLNAVVKMPGGKRIVSYKFIKGYASMVFAEVLRRRPPDVDVYWDASEGVAYFRVLGIQFSFHYIPMTAELQKLMNGVTLARQRWDGRRLQEVAADLFLLSHPDLAKMADDAAAQAFLTSGCSDHQKSPPEAFVSPVVERHPAEKPVASKPLSAKKRKWYVRHHHLMRYKRHRFVSSLYSLQRALTFDIRQVASFQLYHAQDKLPLNYIFYTGCNYEQLRELMLTQCPDVSVPLEEQLRPGRLYYVSPQRHVASLPPQRWLSELARNNFLWDEHHHCYVNLCVSYGIARYLTARYPRLRFINTLNFNRMVVRSRFYSHADLRRVPMGSKSRQLRVWMVANVGEMPPDFMARHLPYSLLSDFWLCRDYNVCFELTHRRGRVGLYAYSRYHLLKPVYRDIVIRGNFAFVQRDDGLIAIYGLMEERFKTDFVYHRIWYVPKHYTLYGQTGTTVTVICQLRPDAVFPLFTDL